MTLINLSRATELVPNFPSSDNTVLQDCINAAQEQIERYCNRTFELQTYDEVYDGSGDYNLLLNNYPVTAVYRVSFNPVNVLQMRMTDQGTSRASWRLDGTTDQPPKPNNLYLVSLKNGVETDITIGPLTSATPTVTIGGGSPTTIPQMLTLNDLASAVNSYAGSYGWAALALGIFADFSISDIRPPQGAFESRWFGVSYMTLHSWNQSLFDYNPDVGEIVSPMGFNFGYRNFRIVYQAGFSSIPYQIQQACAALAVSVYQSRNVNANLSGENLGGYSYSNIAEKNFHSMDIVSRYGLPLYKNHRVAKFKLTW